MQRVMRLGLPTTRDETWRYTNLRHLTSHGFIDAPPSAPGLLQPTASPVVGRRRRVGRYRAHGEWTSGVAGRHRCIL